MVPPFISFAQNFEDVMLRRVLRSVEVGFYIEVGAGGPLEDTMSRTFYESGWSGINVEPSISSWEAFCSARPRDINLNIASGHPRESADFFLINGGAGLSTMNAALAQEHAERGHRIEAVNTRVVSLAQICAEHVRGDIHFMNVDVEGCELEVIESADFSRFRPWILVIEATLPDTQIPSYERWEPSLLKAGYIYAYFDGLNRFYVAQERCAELQPAFATPPNVFDNFVGHREHRARQAEAALEAKLIRTRECLEDALKLLGP